MSEKEQSHPRFKVYRARLATLDDKSSTKKTIFTPQVYMAYHAVISKADCSTEGNSYIYKLPGKFASCRLTGADVSFPPDGKVRTKCELYVKGQPIGNWTMNSDGLAWKEHKTFSTDQYLKFSFNVHGNRTEVNVPDFHLSLDCE